MAVDTEPTSTSVDNVEDVKVGLDWKFLGIVRVSCERLGGHRSLEVLIDCKWEFPSAGNPKDPGNLVIWQDGTILVRENKDWNSVKSDPNLIAGHHLFSSGPGLAMRMCVIPTKGGRSCYGSVVPPSKSLT